jgi:aspartyl protease family protein
VNSLVYRANGQGHVFIDGYANGSGVRFMLDTGATLVALTVSDATAAGVNRSDLRFDHHVSTANGVANVAQVRLREVRIGQFSAADVPAVVVQNLSISLLGQSFLKRLDSYEMRDGVLTMNWN